LLGFSPESGSFPNPTIKTRIVSGNMSREGDTVSTNEEEFQEAAAVNGTKDAKSCDCQPSIKVILGKATMIDSPAFIVIFGVKEMVRFTKTPTDFGFTSRVTEVKAPTGPMKSNLVGFTFPYTDVDESLI